MLRVQDGMILIFVGVIFAVLSFGLVNTIVMAVFERMREFGLMQALGMRPITIMYQVLMESFLMLALGLFFGNLLAVLTIRPLESGIDLSGVAEGLEMFGMGTTLYPSLRIADMVATSALVIVLGLLASLLPAWRAARFDPIEALGKT
jgi:ABC-type lipoprotein release transport system permease subunit